MQPSTEPPRRPAAGSSKLKHPIATVYCIGQKYFPEFFSLGNLTGVTHHHNITSHYLEQSRFRFTEDTDD